MSKNSASVAFSQVFCKMSKIATKLKPHLDRFSVKNPPRVNLDSDSLTSFFFSWQPKHRHTPPHAIQTGRIITASEFYLFYISIMLLVLATGLISMSVWSIIFKIPFRVLIDTSTELAYFTLPGAILCLPCFWIVLSVHNDEKAFKLLFLVLLLLTFAIVLTAIGLYVGFTHKLRAENMLVATEEEFRTALSKSLRMVKENKKIQKAWDQIQLNLKCCGVGNYSDWLRIRTSIPPSCCGDGVTCRYNSTSSNGCLKIIIATMALLTRVFNGINCVALFMMSCTLVTVVSVYLSGMKNQQQE